MYLKEYKFKKENGDIFQTKTISNYKQFFGGDVFGIVEKNLNIEYNKNLVAILMGELDMSEEENKKQNYFDDNAIVNILDEMDVELISSEHAFLQDGKNDYTCLVEFDEEIEYNEENIILTKSKIVTVLAKDETQLGEIFDFADASNLRLVKILNKTPRVIEKESIEDCIDTKIAKFFAPVETFEPIGFNDWKHFQ